MAGLADTRLLTLTGVGGCGKTRPALEVARGVIDDYADGVWLVELGPLVDPALVAQRVAAVLGVRETAEQPLTTALASALRRCKLLLVLDNCEHLLDACAQLIEGLLRACPDLRVLTTSREPIGIGGEVAWRVPSLAVPEADSAPTPEQVSMSPAVQLFVQRATAAQPRFALTARNASAVAQICRRLDGIPLALELAAARVEVLTAEQVALRLDQRFRLLTGGSRAALPRVLPRHSREGPAEVRTRICMAQAHRLQCVVAADTHQLLPPPSNRCQSPRLAGYFGARSRTCARSSPPST
jgi:predicted ATPase